MAFRSGANSTNNIRAASNDAYTSCLNTGTTNTTAQLKIYSGSQPATPETTETGTLLATINFANPAYGSSDSTGMADLAGGTPITGSVATAGTAGWFRVYDRDGHAMFDGAISTSGAELNFDSTSFVQDGTVKIASLSIQTPM